MPRPLRTLIGCLTVAAALGSGPAQAHTLHQEPDAARVASAGSTATVWLPYWSMPEALASVRGTTLFDVASPFWYDATSCGRVIGHQGAGSRAVLRTLRERGLTVVPTITASGLAPRTAVRCLGDPDRRRAHVRAILAVVGSRVAYRGIDIDYEHLAVTVDRRQARRVQRAFSVFVGELCAALHDRGKVCHITVMPRESDELTIWRGKLLPGVFDYARLGAAADRVRVMAYDQHAGAYGPGPVAGYPWVSRVTRYALGKVPAQRLVLGVPTYARDFSRGSSRSLTTRAALALARQRGVVPTFDPVQREHVFRYRAGGVRHTVWLSSRRAVALRSALTVDRGLAGTAYWAAGMEQAGTWRAVERVAAR